MDEIDDYQYTKHEKKAMELFKSGRNCSQSVLVAFADETDLDMELSLKLASSFGAGMGGLRSVCGAVSAMLMVVGIKQGFTDVKDKDGKAAHYKLIQEMTDKFQAQAGSIICKDLLSLKDKSDIPVISERTEKYYTERPCERLVGLAARIIDEYLEK